MSRVHDGLLRALRRWQLGRAQAEAGTEAGDTLVEVLLALIVLGLATTALLFGFATSITASAQHRSLANQDASVRSAINQAIALVQTNEAQAFGSCPSTWTPTWPTLTGKFEVTAYTVQYWNATSSKFGAACPTTSAQSAPQEWSLTISNANSGAQQKYTTQASTVIYNPAAQAGSGSLSASKLVWLQSPTAGTAGSPVTPQPQIAVEDANNNIVTNDFSQVTLSVSSGPSGGTLSSSCSGIESYGVVSFANCSLSTAGTYTLKASDSTSGITPAFSSAFTVGTSPTARIVLSSGTTSGTASQTANIGPITVQTQDQFGNATTAGATVALTSSSGSGVFSLTQNGPAVTSVTIAAGSSSVNVWYGNTAAGTQTLTGSATNLAPGTLGVTVNPGPPSKVAFASSPFTAATSSPLAATQAFTVSLEDQYGNVTKATASTQVTLSVSAGSSTGRFASNPGGSASTPLNVNINSGSTGVTAYYGDTAAGTPTLKATTGSYGSATQQETMVAPPTKLVFLTGPLSGPASNRATLGPVTVQEQTAGSQATTLPLTVTLASTSNGAIFSLTQNGSTPVTTVTIPAGSSTATFYYGDTKAGSPRITASSGALTAATQNETISAGPLSQLVLSTPSPTAGTQFNESITAADAYGNTVTSVTGPQAFSFSGPSNSPNNTAPTYPATVTFAAGVGSAPMTLFDAQTVTLTATGAGATGSASLTVSAGATTLFSMPAPIPTAGVPFTEIITATDNWGNTTPGYGGNQCLTFSGPANSPNNTAPSYPGRGSGFTRCPTGQSQVAFTNGVGNATITLYDAQTTTLNAVAGGVSGATPLFTVVSGAPGAFTVANPGTQTAGVAFNVTITSTDAYGNTESGTQNVTWSGPANSPNGTVPLYPSSLTFNASGQATASVTLYDAQSTTLTVHSGAVQGTSTSFTVRGGPASAFTLPTPATQTAGTQFNETVSASDTWGNVATGYTGTQCVAFSGPLASPGGTQPAYPARGACAAGSSSLTFTNGSVSVPITLYDAATGVVLTATQGTFTGSTNGFTVNSGAVASFAIPSSPGTRTAGTAFAVTVTASDAFGNAYSGTVNAVSFTGPGTSPAPASRAPAYPTSLTFAGGTASATMTLYDAQAGITLTVSATGVSAGTSPAFSVNPAATSQLLFTTQPAGSVGEGTAFTTQPVLTAEDSYSNVTPGYANAVTLNVNTYTAGGGGKTQGTLGCTANPVTPVSGVATFAACNITGTAAAGTYNFKGTDGTITSAASNNVTITAGGTATQLVFSAQPVGGVTEGTNFATQPVLTAQDANGNTVTSFASNVTLSINTYTAGGGGTTKGTLGCNANTVAAVNGVATFAGCDISGTAAAGTYTLTGAGGSLTSAASSNVVINSGTATQLVLTTQPAGPVSEGTAFSTQPVLTAEDASGNTVTSFNGAADNVTLAINTYTASGGGTTKGTLGCTANPVTPVNGVATFAGCNITGAAGAGTYNFKATGGGLTSAVSNNVVVNAGAATQLVFSAQPVGGVTEGTNFATQPVLTAQDANGNTVTSFASNVTLSINTYTAGGGGTTKGTLGCNANTVAAVNGVATFAGCDISGTAAAGTYTLTGAGGSLTSAASSNVVIKAGTLSALSIPTAPSSPQTAGTPFSISVTGTDAFGNGISGTVAVSFAGGNTAPNTTTPTYPSSLTFTNGSATAPVTLVATQNGVQLTVSATGASAGTSPAFNVVAGSAGSLSFSTQPVGGVTEGTALGTQPVLRALDAYGNVATSFAGAADNVTLSVASYTAGNGGTTQGSVSGCTANPVTPISGVATFGACKITGSAGAGTYTLRGVGGSLTSPASNNVVITAGTATTLTATSGSGQSRVTGSAFANPLVATVTDANGNGVSGVTVTFTSPSSADATFASAGCVSNSPTTVCTVNTGTNGQATSSLFTAGATATTYNITASATGVTSTTFSETNVARPTVTSVASNSSFTGTSGTTGTFTQTSGDTYIATAFTNSSTRSLPAPTVTIGGQAMTLLSGSTNNFGGTNSPNCPTANVYCYEWTWTFTAATTGTVSVNMSGVSGNAGTSLDVLRVVNADPTTPVVQVNVASGCSSNSCSPNTSTATANLSGAPGTGSVTVEVIGSDYFASTIGTLSWTNGGTNLFNTSNGNNSLATYVTSPAQQNNSASVAGWSTARSRAWGTIALEIGGA